MEQQTKQTSGETSISFVMADNRIDLDRAFLVVRGRTALNNAVEQHIQSLKHSLRAQQMHARRREKMLTQLLGFLLILCALLVSACVWLYNLSPL